MLWACGLGWFRATIVAQYISALAYPVLLLSRKKTYLNKLIGPVECAPALTCPDVADVLRPLDVIG